MKFLEEIPIKTNGTILIIGEVQHIICPDEVVNKQRHIDLEELNSVGISGLNSYYRLEKLGRFPYARVEELPDFQLKNETI